MGYHLILYWILNPIELTHTFLKMTFIESTSTLSSEI